MTGETALLAGRVEFWLTVGVFRRGEKSGDSIGGKVKKGQYDQAILIAEYGIKTWMVWPVGIRRWRGGLFRHVAGEMDEGGGVNNQ